MNGNIDKQLNRNAIKHFLLCNENHSKQTQSFNSGIYCIVKGIVLEKHLSSFLTQNIASTFEFCFDLLRQLHQNYSSIVSEIFKTTSSYLFTVVCKVLVVANTSTVMVVHISC